MDLIPLFSKHYHNNINHLEDNQRLILQKILYQHTHTQIGNDYHFENIRNYSHFKKQVPIARYEEIKPYIEAIGNGGKNILSTNSIMAFARTSGTSTANKLIPVTKHFIKKNHQYASRMILYCLKHNYGFPNYVIGKNFSLAGYFYENHQKIKCADVSALIIAELPLLFKPFNFPNKAFYSWQDKIDYILAHWKGLDQIKMMSGVPTWVLSIFNELEQFTGKTTQELLPNLELYVHGGVSFKPYRDTFKNIFGDQVKYLETYNATEGFLAFQNDPDDPSLLVVNNAEVFFEFIPFSYDQPVEESKIVPLWEVEKDQQYLVVLTTSAGLYRYILGDTVKFTTLFPHKLIIEGREKEYINAFGEDLYLSQVYQALEQLEKQIHFKIEDFFVVPRFITSSIKGRHEWYVEFRDPPHNFEKFAQLLDTQLQTLSNNYQQKRNQNKALEPLSLYPLPPKTIQNFLAHKGKIGGQIKMKKLHNDRSILKAFDFAIL